MNYLDQLTQEFVSGVKTSPQQFYKPRGDGMQEMLDAVGGDAQGGGRAAYQNYSGPAQVMAQQAMPQAQGQQAPPPQQGQPGYNPQLPTQDPQMLQHRQALLAAQAEVQRRSTTQMGGVAGGIERINDYIKSPKAKEAERAAQALVDTDNATLSGEQRVKQAKLIHKTVMDASGDADKAQNAADLVLADPTQESYKKFVNDFSSAINREDVNVKRQVDYVNGLPDGEDKELAMKLLFKNSGDQIKAGIDGEGNPFVLMATDGSELPSQSTNMTKVEDQIINAEAAQQRLGDLKGAFNPDYLGLKAKFKGIGGTALDWVRMDGNPDLKIFAAKQNAFVTKNSRFVDQYRRAVTGAQASQIELERIESRLMRAASQGPVTWMIEFNSVMREQNQIANESKGRIGMDPLPVEDNLVFSEEEIYEQASGGSKEDLKETTQDAVNSAVIDPVDPELEKKRAASRALIDG